MNSKPDTLLNYYQEILNISKQMLDISRKPDEEGLWMEDFTQLVDKRAGLIKEIESNKARLDISAWEGEKVREFILQIQDFDKEVSNQIQSQMGFLRGKIGNVRQNVKAQSAYLGSDSNADGWFFDSRE